MLVSQATPFAAGVALRLVCETIMHVAKEIVNDSTLATRYLYQPNHTIPCINLCSKALAHCDKANNYPLTWPVNCRRSSCWYSAAAC